ncbi:MAG: YgiQ family radical SAM protein [Candidatus Omnitrophica bacterium]|nr:YgiQ family radical SAM protein [Candidatus Omnitrophota bacterium]MBU1808433.1 YgiQ family radical SAM protein [Candidatus Omnitrophota bacterium]
MNDLLPTTKVEMSKRGWSSLDIIIVTGDAYVDHPSYGAAVISRVLEAEGYKVGVIAQPDLNDPDDLKRMGKPRLFFGVTAGNLDSMIANYTANKKFRSGDEYSPGGIKGLRPDRATLIYTNKLKQAFDNVPVVIGGIEAGMRRLAHYDYWSDTVRRSILLDSKADILVYGMGEEQIVEIARHLKNGRDIKDLNDIRGTVIVRNCIDAFKSAVEIPSFEEVACDKDKFNEAFRLAYPEAANPVHGRVIIQRHARRFVIQLPPTRPLSQSRMDSIYELPFARSPHPGYRKAGGVPGFDTVKHSVITHRGCPGECSFCSLYAHQGRIVQSRSAGSILRELEAMASQPDFNGTITDIGGPTANMYEAHCELWKGKGACRLRRCLFPDRCKNLKLRPSRTIDLWKRASLIKGIKHIFVGSGVRYDLLNDKESDEFLKHLCASHVSGQLKVAPEHTEPHILDAMGKPRFGAYELFIHRFDAVNKALKKKQFLVNYFISGHPGATTEDALKLSLKLKKMRIYPEQIQDYIPLPMTASGAMYYTGKDPFSGRRIYVEKSPRARRLQRALIQYKNDDNKRYVIEALRLLGRMDLMNEFYGQ